MSEYRPKYKWRLSWPDSVDDFTGLENGRSFGRFYRRIGGMAEEEWWWTMNCIDLDPRFGSHTSGLAVTRREACRKIEEIYDAAKDGGWIKET